MKKTGLIIFALIIGGVVFWVWNRQNSPDHPAERKIDEKTLEKKEKADIEGFSFLLNGSYSNQPHAPTPLELAIDLREISPSLTGSLLKQFNNSPEVFAKNEAAALILATLFLGRNDWSSYDMLATMWKQKSDWPSAWFVLEGDALVAQNKKEEAVAHLKSDTFSGSLDVARISRLALLSSEGEAEELLAALQEKRQQYPENPFLPILIARTLEKQTRITEAAQELSKELKQSGSSKIQQADALAELFRRYGYQPFAISLWGSVGKDLSSEMKAKLMFWERVVSASAPREPLKIDSNDLYLIYLASLPEGQFWNIDKFKEITNSKEILETHQEAYWLYLLSLLAQNDYQAALALIRSSSFKGLSWNQYLENALEIALNKKLNGEWPVLRTAPTQPLDIEYGTAAWNKPEENPFILDIIAASTGNGEVTSQIEALVDGKNAFSAILLAEGWEKAALELYKDDDSEEAYPNWFLVNLTKAMAREKGTKAALDFALKQPKSDELDLQIAELHLEGSRPEEGLKVLESLRTERGGAGVRAAWMTVQYYLRKGRLDLARQIILANDELAETPMGQETLTIISSKLEQQPVKR